MSAQSRNNILLLIGVFLLLGAGYYAFGYVLDRSQSEILLVSYAGLWLLSWPWLRITNKTQYLALNSWRTDFYAGLILRMVLLFSWPQLSQDVYRFLWDGALFAQGISPYLYTPNSLITAQEPSGIDIPNAAQLLSNMGALSASNFSNYPTIKQIIFALPYWLGLTGIMAQISMLRVVIILADIGVFFIGRRLLLYRSLNPKYINWYFLNPLIILELTGNCHFEGIMALSLLTGLLMLVGKRYLLSGTLLGVGIGIKLIPLMLVPVIVAYILREDKNSSIAKPLLYFGTGLMGTTALTFIPLLNPESLTHYTETTGLWFTKFEFNASIYYLLRWIGFQWKGYNLIAQIGPALSLITLLIILYLSYRVWRKRADLFQVMMYSILVYLFCATTVHPWYWTTALVLSILVKSRIGLMGSLFIFLSYTAYRGDMVREQGLWLSIEYISLFAYILWEHNKKKLKKPELI